MGTLLLILLIVIALFIVGGFVIGLTLQLLWYAIIGIVFGALARLVLPGEQNIGLLATALFGIAGALTGAILASALDVGTIIRWLLAIAAAALFIALYEGVVRGRRA